MTITETGATTSASLLPPVPPSTGGGSLAQGVKERETEGKQYPTSHRSPIHASYMTRMATTTIPVVFPNAINPLETGVVASLAHPGGNVTGGAIPTAELSARAERAAATLGLPLEVREVGDSGLEAALERLLEATPC